MRSMKEIQAKNRNPSAFQLSDRWIVVNTETGEPVESSASEERCRQAAAWCNEHEERQGRAPVYGVEQVTH